jgi:hypothetical protein
MTGFWIGAALMTGFSMGAALLTGFSMGAALLTVFLVDLSSTGGLFVDGYFTSLCF